MAKAKAPHRAQLSISIMVYDVLNDGALSGRPLSEEEMLKYGVKHKNLIEVNGFDQFETMKKVKEKLDDLRK